MSQLKDLAKKAYILATRNMSDEKYLHLLYARRYGEKLHLNPPVLFTEKLQWLKLHAFKPEYTRMVDKLGAKAYVDEVLGAGYTIPTLGVWDRAEDVDFDALPERFVLKCTHDSGGLVICKDKSRLDRAQAVRTLKNCLSSSWYEMHRERPYKDVRPRVLAEEYLENDEKEGLHDYKVWCFDGEPVYVQYISGRLEKTCEGFYDKDWKLQDFTFHNPKIEEDVPRPIRLEELLGICRKLAKDTPFLRVDFYILADGSLRFGEITFYPMSGLDHFHPEEMNKTLGDMLRLPER